MVLTHHLLSLFSPEFLFFVYYDDTHLRLALRVFSGYMVPVIM